MNKVQINRLQNLYAHLRNESLLGERLPHKINKDFVNASINTSIFSKEHWKSIASQIKQEEKFLSQRLEAFKNIHGMVSDAIHEIHSMHDGQIGPEFVEEIGEVMMLINKNQEDKDGQYGRFGGKIGNRIFQEFARKITVPMLSELIKRFIEDPERRNLDYNSNVNFANIFLGALLDVAGEERKIIAKMTATKNYERYGQRITDPEAKMHDYVSAAPSWNPWNALVSNNINATILAAWKEHCAKHGAVDFHEFFMKSRNAVVPTKSFVSFRNGNRTIQLGLDIEREGYFFLNDWAPVSISRSGYRSSYEFRWKLEEDKTVKATLPIKVEGLVCIHPALKKNILEKTIAEDFLQACMWQGDGSLQSIQYLQDRFSSIIDKFAQSTTFLGGQSSIAEFFVMAIADLHGLDLEFMPAWTAPENPNPDQQALSEPSHECFIKAGRENIQLRPKRDIERKASL